MKCKYKGGFEENADENIIESQKKNKQKNLHNKNALKKSSYKISQDMISFISHQN